MGGSLKQQKMLHMYFLKIAQYQILPKSTHSFLTFVLVWNRVESFQHYFTTKLRPIQLHPNSGALLVTNIQYILNAASRSRYGSTPKVTQLSVGSYTSQAKKFSEIRLSFLGYEEKNHTDIITHEPSSQTTARVESSSQYWMTGLKGKMHF